jgi:hypothetical protein
MSDILNWLKDTISNKPKFKLAVAAVVVLLVTLYVLKHYII